MYGKLKIFKGYFFYIVLLKKNQIKVIENCPLKNRKTPDTSYYIRLKYPEENVINQIFDEVILFR